MKQLLWTGAIALAPLGAASAWQSTPPPAIRPVPPSVRFEQDARQQKLRDDLQKSQLQQQLHNDVSDTARRPAAKGARALKQLDSAQDAQGERDRAAQQDLLDRERNVQRLPRVVPKALPKSDENGG